MFTVSQTIRNFGVVLRHEVASATEVIELAVPACDKWLAKPWVLKKSWPNRLQWLQNCPHWSNIQSDSIRRLTNTSETNEWLRNSTLFSYLYELLQFEMDRRALRISALRVFDGQFCLSTMVPESKGGWPWNPRLRHPTLDVMQFRVIGPGLGVSDLMRHPVAGHLLLPTHITQFQVLNSSYLMPLHAGLNEHHVIIQSRDSNGQLVLDHNDATFHVRLFGLSIVPAEVESIGGGEYKATFVVRDPGEYVLEVRASWIEEGPVDGHGFNLGRVVYRSEHPIRVFTSDRVDGQCEYAPALYPMKPTMICCHGASEESCQQQVSYGRWVHVQDGHCDWKQEDVFPPESHCQLPEAQDLFKLELNDPIGLNWNYVWVPYNCHLQAYDKTAIQSCVERQTRRTDSVFSFRGDSVGREMLQNVQLITVNFKPLVAMRKLKLSSWETSIGNFSFQWNQEPPLGSFISFVQESIPHLLFDLKTRGKIPMTEFQWSSRLNLHAKECQDRGVVHCYLYIDPPVQRAVDHWKRLVENIFFEGVTPDRHRSMIRSLRQSVQSSSGKQPIEILDGYSIASAHWWGSWDGLHYSEVGDNFAPEGSDEFKSWYGGVSAMITQVLLNQICNRQATNISRIVS